MNNLIRSTIFMVALLMLISCVGGGKIPEDHYYRLPDIANKSAGPGTGLSKTVSINSVRASGILNERSMLYVDKNKPNEINIYHYRHWVNSPAKMIKQHLDNYLDNISHEYNAPDKEVNNKDNDINLTVTLLKFERVVSSNEITAQVIMKLSHSTSGKDNTSKVYSANVPADDDSIYSTVNAFGKALEDIYTRWLKNVNML